MIRVLIMVCLVLLIPANAGVGQYCQPPSCQGWGPAYVVPGRPASTLTPSQPVPPLQPVDPGVIQPQEPDTVQVDIDYNKVAVIIHEMMKEDREYWRGPPGHDGASWDGNLPLLHVRTAGEGGTQWTVDIANGELVLPPVWLQVPRGDGQLKQLIRALGEPQMVVLRSR